MWVNRKTPLKLHYVFKQLGTFDYHKIIDKINSMDLYNQYRSMTCRDHKRVISSLWKNKEKDLSLQTPECVHYVFMFALDRCITFKEDAEIESKRLENLKPETIEYTDLVIIDGVFIQGIKVYRWGVVIGMSQEKYIIKDGKLEKIL